MSHNRAFDDPTPSGASVSTGGVLADGGGFCAGCTRLLESDHRIANHFALLAGYVRLQRDEMTNAASQTSDPRVLATMNSIIAQISVMSGLHRSLSRDPFADIVDISRYLRESCEPFRQGIAGRVSVTSAFKPECLVQMRMVLPITQIMVEIITNSLKHAHEVGEAGTIIASCGTDRLGAFTLEVADDGAGLPASLDPAVGRGLGFRIVRALAQKIGATIGYTSTGRGVTFQLTLPVTQAA